MAVIVPYLAEEAIERDASALLAEFARARNFTIKAPIPIEDIVEKHLRLGIEFDDMHARFHAMYVDKLDGVIDAEFFERTSRDWREQQDQCQRQIELHQAADQSYLDEGVQLLELARSAQSLFSRQEPREKR